MKGSFPYTDFVRRNTHSNTDSNTQTNVHAGPVRTATTPYIRGTSETIARILQSYNIYTCCTQVDNLFTTNVKDKDKPEDKYKRNGDAITLLNTWTFTDETSNRLELYDMCVFYRLLSTTHFSESWFTNLEQTPRNRNQQLPTLYKRLIDDEIKQN